MIEEVREFLALFEGEPNPGMESIRALMKALDKLSCAYHETKRCFIDSRKEPPKENFSEDVKLVARYFPDFGYYPVVYPLDDISVPPSMGDAIDDLADIRRELLAVLWRWDNVGEADAENSFRDSYEIHWGRHHLPLLRCYVSAKLLET